MAKRTNHKLIVDAIQDGVFIIVREKLMYVNDAFCNITGYSTDEIIGKKYSSLIHPDDANFVEDRHKRRMLGEDVPTEYEFRLIHKNGKVVYIIMSVSMQEYDNQISATGTIKDITHRIESELKLQEAEQTYRTLLDLSPDPIIVTDLNGYIIMHNKVAYDVHEATNEFELIGKRVTDFVRNEKDLNTLINLVCDDDMPTYKYTIDFETRTGRIIPFELNTNTIYDSEGNSKYRITIGRDISKVKQYEHELKALIEEKETLIKEIHHRIKNSLQQVHSLLGIQSESALLKYSLTSDTSNAVSECQNLLQRIISDAKQRILAISIVHQMFYKQTSNKISVSSFVKELIKNIKITYSEVQADIKLKVSGDTMDLCLEHIIPCGLITNEIISNSFKHAFVGRKSGIITVKLKQDGDTNTIIISDDGIGIDKNLIAFGKGLGITLIYGLTEQVGGKVDLKSDENGTVYTMVFNKRYLKG